MKENVLGLPLNLPESASLEGPHIDQLIAMVHWLMIIMFVGWGMFFIYTLIRFNRKNNPKADYVGVKSHASSYLEMGVALTEAFLLVAFSYPIWAQRVKELPPEDKSTVVRVIAEQFAWNISYPGLDGKFGKRDAKFVSNENPIGMDRDDAEGKDDIFVLNDLTLPVNKPVIVHLSTKDVIHSFALQEMRVKQDAIPGMDIPIAFTPIKEGHWEISCAQLCGIGHYRMMGKLNIVSESEYKNWIEEKAKTSTGGGSNSYE